MTVEYRFINDQHEHAYRQAMLLLVAEDSRQASEAARLSKEWMRFPDDARREKFDLLRRHFIECRQPYIKLVADLLALASPVMRLPLS